MASSLPGATGERLKEATKINLSLSALGTVSGDGGWCLGGTGFLFLFCYGFPFWNINFATCFRAKMVSSVDRKSIHRIFEHLLFHSFAARVPIRASLASPVSSAKPFILRCPIDSSQQSNLHSVFFFFKSLNKKQICQQFSHFFGGFHLLPPFPQHVLGNAGGPVLPMTRRDARTRLAPGM